MQDALKRSSLLSSASSFLKNILIEENADKMSTLFFSVWKELLEIQIDFKICLTHYCMDWFLCNLALQSLWHLNCKFKPINCKKRNEKFCQTWSAAVIEIYLSP